jgi:DNA-binding response OmpR family regulator
VARKKVLVIEPEEAISSLIEILLSERYDVESADLTEPHRGYDLLLFDIFPPYQETISALGRIRPTTSPPLVVMSASIDDSVRHAAMQAGADDFLVQPFDPDRLLACVRHLLEDQEGETSDTTPLRVGPLEVDFGRNMVSANGKPVRLGYSEWLIFESLASPPGQPCLHAELLTKVWGAAVKYDHEFLGLWIDRIRRKLGFDPSNPRLIRPYHDIGYVLTA